MAPYKWNQLIQNHSSFSADKNTQRMTKQNEIIITYLYLSLPTFKSLILKGRGSSVLGWYHDLWLPFLFQIFSKRSSLSMKHQQQQSGCFRHYRDDWVNKRRGWLMIDELANCWPLMLDRSQWDAGNQRSSCQVDYFLALYMTISIDPPVIVYCTWDWTFLSGSDSFLRGTESCS